MSKTLQSAMREGVWPCLQPPNELLAKLIRNPPGWRRGEPRWAAVKRLLNFGSTTSSELCAWAKTNPDKIKL